MKKKKKKKPWQRGINNRLYLRSNGKSRRFSNWYLLQYFVRFFFYV